MARVQSSYWPRLLVLCCSSVLMLAFAEGVSRYAETRIAASGLQYLTEYDAQLGWSKAANQERVHRTHEFEATERTNSRGLRGPDTPFDRTPGRPRLLMLGDSFLEGVAVEEAELVSSVVRDRVGAAMGVQVEVVNGGTVGYSTDQELLFYRLHGREYGPDVTVLLFYVNDIWFNARSRYWRGEKPRFVLEGTGLRLTNSPVPTESREYLYEVTGGQGLGRAVRLTDSWLGLRSAFYRLSRQAAINVPFIHSYLIESGLGAVSGERMPWRKESTPELAEAFRMTGALLLQLRDETEEDGSKFVVYHVPPRAAVYPADWAAVRDASAMNDIEWDPTQDGLWLRSFCRENGVDCIVDFESFRAGAGSLSEPGEALYSAEDTHWTARGHALAGRLIADHLIEQGVLPEAESGKAAIE